MRNRVTVASGYWRRLIESFIFEMIEVSIMEAPQQG
jgi:hypothetical protein